MYPQVLIAFFVIQYFSMNHFHVLELGNCIQSKVVSIENQ